MRLLKSKLGLTFSLLYLVVSIFLIFSQGLFSESFIAVFLGMPWQYIIIYFGLHKIVGLYAWLLAPIILNAIILYWVGVGIQKLLFRKNQV